MWSVKIGYKFEIFPSKLKTKSISAKITGSFVKALLSFFETILKYYILENKLPWRLPADLKHFQRVTIGNGNNAVFMGRTTWESIPPKFRPLKDRTNFVLSSKMEQNDKCQVVRSMDELETKLDGFDEVWCIGGAMIYQALLKESFIKRF